MESQTPQMALHVSDKYSYQEIPGFFTVNYFYLTISIPQKSLKLYKLHF